MNKGVWSEDHPRTARVFRLKLNRNSAYRTLSLLSGLVYYDYLLYQNII